MNKIKNWKEHWTNSWEDDSEIVNNGKHNTEVYLSKMTPIKINLDVETEILKKHRTEFIDMATRLQRGQDGIYQKKYKQPTVENYIKTLNEQITEISKELTKRGG